MIEVAHGHARIQLDGTESRRLGRSASAVIYNGDDLLSATAAALRAAADPRAEAVAALVVTE